MLCSCQECNKVLQNCHFSQEAFQSLSDHIDQINNVIKTSCDFLAVSCPNEILQYKHTKANLKCVDAQIKLSILFFQFLIWTLNKNKFSFQKDKNNENLVSVAFIPFHIGQDFIVKIEKGKFNIFNKNPITIEAMNTLKLNLELIIGLAGKLNDLDLKIQDLTLLNSPIFSSKLF